MIPYADADPRSIRALSHPLRVRMLAFLGDRSLTAAQLASELQSDPRTVASHARTLERLGYVGSTRDPRKEGEVRYHLVASVQIPDHVWAETPTTAKRDTIAAALDQLQLAASAALADGGFDRADAHLTRTGLELDEEGWRQLSSEMLDWLDRIGEIGKEAAERMVKSRAHVMHVTANMMLFEMAMIERPDHEPSSDEPGEDFSPAEGLELAFQLNEQLEQLLVRPNPPLAEVVALIDQLRVVARAVMAEQDRPDHAPVDRD